jgi:hypothetical protein
MASFFYMPSQKPEFPPLLPAGLHDLSKTHIKELCVDRFPLSKTRPAIFEGLCQVIIELEKAEIVTDLLIDGGFLTESINPKDADLVACMESASYESLSVPQRLHLDQMQGGAATKAYLCHFYLSVTWPTGHKRHHDGQLTRTQWLDWFGHSRKPKRTPKGIGVVRFGESVQNMVMSVPAVKL